MQHRSRNVIAALLASSMLALAGLSGVAAHAPGGPGFPGSSAKPLPSGWAWPTDLKTHAVKSHAPAPAKSPQPSKTPKVVPPIDCTSTSTSSPTPTASATASAAVAATLKDKLPGMGAAWDKRMGAFRDHFNANMKKMFCATVPLRKTLDGQITHRISALQGLEKQVGKSALSASNVATVDGVLNALIADLKALKTKVDAETTLAALQADYHTLANKASVYNLSSLWVQEIVGAEKVIAAGPGLITLENKVAAEIAAAPAGSETADAQLYLDDMKLAVTEGEAFAAPLPAILLAITSGQLADGSAKATLTSTKATLFLAMWDIQLAHRSAQWAEHEIKEVMATPKPTATAPTATPTATPI